MVMMVTYDLKKPGQHYKAVEELLESASGGYCHAQGSVWLIDSARNAAWWRTALGDRGDFNDLIFVTPIGRGWASRNMSIAAAWLNSSERNW